MKLTAGGKIDRNCLVVSSLNLVPKAGDWKSHKLMSQMRRLLGKVVGLFFWPFCNHTWDTKSRWCIDGFTNIEGVDGSGIVFTPRQSQLRNPTTIRAFTDVPAPQPQGEIFKRQLGRVACPWGFPTKSSETLSIIEYPQRGLWQNTSNAF